MTKKQQLASQIQEASRSGITGNNGILKANNADQIPVAGDSVAPVKQTHLNNRPVSEYTNEVEDYVTGSIDTRVTMIMNEYNYEMIAKIAYWGHFTIKDIMNTALTDYIRKYEKENPGQLKEIPGRAEAKQARKLKREFKKRPPRK